jgi:sarcosine oxidase subunit gamma
VSFDFLAVDAAAAAGGRTPLARSPMERLARAAGGRFEARDGWNVAVAFAGESAGGLSWSDVSHLGKLELQAAPDDLAAAVERCADIAVPELGQAARAGSTWWCPISRERVLAICPASETGALRERLEEAAATAASPATALELTTAYAGLAISGAGARELLARFCALDLRPQVMPVGAFRPGSVARTPGFVLRETEDRYLAFVGAALGEYLWTVVADAAGPLGGAPAGFDALRPVEAAGRA